jgi:hypothetical protein
VIDDPKKNSEIASEVTEQFKVSRDWFAQNYYPEWAEIYRNVQCRVAPLMKKGKDGSLVEDKTSDRTNVCLTDHYVMRRRKVDRLTVNAPSLRVRGGSDGVGPDGAPYTAQQQRDKVSARLYYSWDKSGFQRTFKKVVDSATMFGWGVSKSYQDKIQVVRRLKRVTAKLTLSDLLNLQGDEQVAAAVKQMRAAGTKHADVTKQAAKMREELQAQNAERVKSRGQDVASQDEIANAIAQFGDTVSLQVPTVKYDGPVGSALFVGDVFPEPGFLSLNQSAYVIERCDWDMPRLTYWAKQKWTDPDSGEELPVFDEDALDDFVDKFKDSQASRKPDKNDLRVLLRESIKQSDPQIDGRLRGKRFPMLERHSVTDDGRFRIDFIGGDEGGGDRLGWMCYPWDTYGKYLYSELVLMPDIVGGIGESSLRATKYIMQLRNTRENQITDFINRKLRPLIKARGGAEITDEQLQRTAYGVFIRLKEMDDIQPFQDPSFPVEAFSDVAGLVREMQQAEPAMADYSPGTENSPMAGKFATTALLQSKSANVSTQAQLNQIGDYVADVLHVWMAIDQQSMSEAVEIQRGESDRIDALSIFGNDQVRSIRVEPMELQEDFEIFPIADSVLAVDDDFRAGRMMQFGQLAFANPDVYNKAEVAKQIAETIPGVDVTKIMAPPPQPPQPDVRTSITISVKWPELADDAQIALLEEKGLPTEGTKAKAAIQGIKEMGEAGRAADELLSEGTGVGGEAGDIGMLSERGVPVGA